MKLRKKYRVFIFQPYPKFGGADRSIIRLINGNKSADFTLVSLTKCNYSKYLNKKIEYLEIKSSRVLFSFFKLREKIKYIIDKNKYDKNIFISNQNFANIISILSVYKIKNLKTILIERNHLIELKFSKNIYDLLKKKIILNLIKFSYKKSNAVVGISKKLSLDLSKFIGKKVKTIYNPATDRSIYFQTKSNHYPKRFNKKKEKIILNVGFFEKQKDQITIIKAFKLVKQKYKNVKLLLIGHGSLYGNLKNYVEINDLKKDVIFITSNCKSGPMEIIKNGKYGYYFNVGDYHELSNKIIKFIKNPKDLKKKTIQFKKIIKKFSLKENSNNYEKLFKQI